MGVIGGMYKTVLFSPVGDADEDMYHSEPNFTQSNSLV